MRAFKIVTASTSTGPRLFVAVDHYIKPNLLHAADTNIILTVDAADQAEFDGMVDELISELTDLKDAAHLQFRMV